MFITIREGVRGYLKILHQLESRDMVGVIITYWPLVKHNFCCPFKNFLMFCSLFTILCILLFFSSLSEYYIFCFLFFFLFSISFFIICSISALFSSIVCSIRSVFYILPFPLYFFIFYFLLFSIFATFFKFLFYSCSSLNSVLNLHYLNYVFNPIWSIVFCCFLVCVCIYMCVCAVLLIWLSNFRDRLLQGRFLVCRHNQCQHWSPVDVRSQHKPTSFSFCFSISISLSPLDFYTTDQHNY